MTRIQYIEVYRALLFADNKQNEILPSKIEKHSFFNQSGMQLAEHNVGFFYNSNWITAFLANIYTCALRAQYI